MLAVALDLALRVVGMSALLCTMGAGPATWLGRDLPPFVRWSLVPALGLSASIGLLTVANWLIPAGVAAWVVLVPALIVSLTVAVRRRHQLTGGTRQDALAVAAIVILIFAAFATPMVAQRSLGPVAYQVFDAPNYVALIDGLQDNAIGDATWGPAWDFSARIGEKFGHLSVQQIGYDSVAATANGLFAWDATATQAPFTIVLLLVGALGVAAAVALIGRDRWPLWLLAGMLYAGPFAYQLFLDGSEAALAGLALTAPTIVLGMRVLRPEAGAPDVVLFSLVAAGASSAYPLTFPTIVVAAIVILSGWAVLELRRAQGGTERIAWLKRLALGLAGTVVLTILFSPYAFERNVRYWYRTLTDDGYFAGLPQFDLPLQVLPSYVLQTREFYYLPRLSDVSLQQWLLGDVIPLALLALIAFGVARRPRTVGFAVVAASGAILAAWASTRSDCSYCVQRSLLPLGPTLIVLLVVAVGAVATLSGRWARVAGWATGIALLAVVGHAGSVTARRAADGAYMLPVDATKTARAAADRPGPIFLEGFGATLTAAAEFQAILHATRESTDARIAFPTETDDYVGLAYLGGPRPAGIEFVPDYRLVLTRLQSIQTERRRLARQGPYALEGRAVPFDVTVVSGVLADRAEDDPDGRAYVQGPMTFWVTGPGGDAGALEVGVEGLASSRVRRPRNARVRRRGSRTVVCIPLEDRAPLRRMTLTFSKLTPMLAPSGAFDPRPHPVGGPTLTSMRVVDGC